MTEPAEVWEYRKRVSRAATEWANARFYFARALIRGHGLRSASREEDRRMNEFLDILYAGPEPTEEES